MKLKTCTKCQNVFPAISEFYCRAKTAKDGLYWWCKKCQREYMQEYNKTPAAKAAQNRRLRKYRSTIKGHLQNIFGSMVQRCTDFLHRNYKNYGGRGIKICFTSSDDFVDYVVNTLQVDPRELTIDRIDNDGDYERGNIRFVTNTENQRNKR